MTQEQIFTGKNLEAAIDTVSLVKSQLKELYWKSEDNVRSSERRIYWAKQTAVYSKRLLTHVGIDPLVIEVVKQVLNMFGSLLPAPVISVIKKLLEAIGIEL